MLEGRSQAELVAIAAMYQYDNVAPGDPGCHRPEALTWTLEKLTPSQLANVFSSPEAARDWLNEEIAIDKEENLCRGWARLLVEDIQDEVVVVFEGDRAYLWDGFHRTAASIARALPTSALVGRLPSASVSSST